MEVEKGAVYRAQMKLHGLFRRQWTPWAQWLGSRAEGKAGRVGSRIRELR